MSSGRRTPALRTAIGTFAVASAIAAAPYAQQAPRLAPLAVTQLDDLPSGRDLDSRTLSLRSVSSLPLKDLLILLFRDTDYSIVPDPDVAGTFSGELKDVTLRQALALVLHPQSLEYEVVGPSIRVFRRRTETRIFEIDYIATQRSARRSVGAATTLTRRGGSVSPNEAADTPASGGSATQVTSTDDADFFQELAAGIPTLLSADGRFNLDRKAAMVQVTDYPDRLDRVALYLDAALARVLRQVQIQARVLEVDLREEYQAGLDWSRLLGAGEGLPVTTALAPSTDAGFTVGLRGQDLQELLRLLATQGRVNVLSSPRVVAMNNEPVIMRVGTQDVFFITTSQIDSTTGRVLHTTATPQAIAEGLVLSVTPQIGADGVINLNISPSVTERTGQARSRFGDTVPILSVRESDTRVRVQDGETIVIAGLTQERTRRQARAFRPDHVVKGKTDLVILLTPTLMAPVPVTAQAWREGQVQGAAPPREDKQP